jgi:acetyl-CoA carboxylase biotin carboxyl carrier protein
MAAIESPVAGRVIQVVVAPGQSVSAGTALVLIECMKMEIPVEAQAAGVVAEIRVAQGDQVKEGEIVAILR